MTFPEVILRDQLETTVSLDTSFTGDHLQTSFYNVKDFSHWRNSLKGNTPIHIYPLHSKADTFVIAHERVAESFLQKFYFHVFSLNSSFFQFMADKVPAPPSFPLAMFLQKTKTVSLESHVQVIQREQFQAIGNSVRKHSAVGTFSSNASITGSFSELSVLSC